MEFVYYVKEETHASSSTHKYILSYCSDTIRFVKRTVRKKLYSILHLSSSFYYKCHRGDEIKMKINIPDRLCEEYDYRRSNKSVPKYIYMMRT